MYNISLNSDSIEENNYQYILFNSISSDKEDLEQLSFQMEKKDVVDDKNLDPTNYGSKSKTFEYECYENKKKMMN